MIQSLQDVLRSAIEIADAAFGNIQLLDPETSDLKIIVHQGFEKDWIDYWNRVSQGVMASAIPHQSEAGVRAVQSSPVANRSGQLLGMLSTHNKHVGRPSERAIRILNLLARQIGDIIELPQVKQQLQNSSRLLEESETVGKLGSWEWDVKTGKINWSKGQYRVYGVAAVPVLNNRKSA